MEFGERLKEIRKSKNLSLREAARRSKVSHPYLSQLESGRNKKPSPEIIRKIADGLNHPYNELMDLAGYGETIHSDSFFTLIDDVAKSKKRTIQVTLPAMKKSNFKNKEIKGHAFGEVSDEELRRMLFDLKDWLNLDVDLFYDRKNLSKEDREKIQTMLALMLGKEN